MRSTLTPLQENRKPGFWKTEDGFSLLEVVVSLAILAGGFLVVLNLFSGSIRSVDFSGQYLKGVTLANSKINELEMLNFNPGELSGNFENEESYRWEVDIAPYDSTLNNPEKGIQLQKVFLKVSWNDQGQTRNVELNTLYLAGQTYPVADTYLEQLFAGGASPVGPGDDGEGEGEGEETPETGTPPSSNISGSSTGSVSGSSSGSNISGN